jgi:hypothetical protein
MRLPLLLALACAVCLVACGGDDEEPAPAGSSAAEESSSGGGSDDWAAQVNAICKRNQQETQQIASRAQEEIEATDERLTAAIIERQVPLQEELLGELRDVEAPEDLADDYEAFLDRIEDGVELFPRLAGSIRTGEEDPDLRTEFEEIAKETQPFAQEQGLTDCITTEQQAG